MGAFNMDNERIEKMLNKIGSADAPAEIRQIAENAADEFSRKIKTMPERKSIQEIIMKGRLIKLAAAAVIILAVIFGIRIFVGGTSVALADVLQKVEQAQAFIYKMKMKTTGDIQPGMPPGEQEMEGTMTMSTEYGMKMDVDMNTNIGGNVQKTKSLMYVVPEEKKIYIITPEKKQYIQMEFDETMAERIKKQSNDPREFLGKIVNSKYTDIGKSVIDGVEVEGFETTDPAVMGGMMEDVKVTLWVDRKTELPVRQEMHYKINEKTQMECELYDFQWYAQVNADEFKPVIPQDYTTMLPGGYKLPSATEEGAIEGLRFCEQLLGRYPKKIDMMNLMNEVMSIKDSNNPTEAAMKLKEEIQGQMSKLPEEEMAKKIMDIMRPVQALGMFQIALAQEKKEPVYYGDIVGPADADKVLLRWKLSDTEYRVIYGNLTAETVSAEKLAELESKLPK
jgi:outer membrane lipoprotein-sorting protein